MQVYHVSEMVDRNQGRGAGSRTTQVYPHGPVVGSLLSVDLLELQAGAELEQVGLPEERVMFVLAGTGELRSAGENGPSVVVSADTVVQLGQNERCNLRNTGSETLRILLSASMLLRSSRALGDQTSPSKDPVSKPEPAQPEAAASIVRPESPQLREQRPAPEPVPSAAPTPSVIVPAVQPDEEPAPVVDLSKLMKRGSQVAAEPRPERRKPLPEPEPEPVQAAEQQQESEPDEEEHGASLMELNVVFDGGSRGNPGQGYGSYLVQSPNRKPVIKRVEFGDNYTNNQAEYDTLIECLIYITERLEVTNRSPSQVQLDIKTDSDLVVNQLLGSFKVKDAGLKVRHTKALDLLEKFGEWVITWHPREESVKLLGH